MHDNCSHCGQQYALDSGNTRLFEYTGDRYRMFSHLMTECPACGGTTRIFVIPAGILEAKHNGICAILEATAPALIQAAYWRAMGVKRLNHHEENQVKFFVWLLDHDVYA